MDRTAPVYIARGELQRAETLLKKANQSKTAVRAPLVMKDAHHLLSTGVLAVLQGRLEEGMKNLLEIVSREDQTHLSGKTYCVPISKCVAIITWPSMALFHLAFIIFVCELPIGHFIVLITSVSTRYQCIFYTIYTSFSFTPHTSIIIHHDHNVGYITKRSVV